MLSIYNSTYQQPMEIRIFQGYGYSHDYGTMFIVYFLRHCSMLVFE